MRNGERSEPWSGSEGRERSSRPSKRRGEHCEPRSKSEGPRFTQSLEANGERSDP
ncbi:hypothetical protein EGH21_14570 [Halomicroarcula sp. F13]|uniref:Uncharacterized protein n=1 Tax=Haloarcula rubra TaxID=2487747 RepID=A0AAW4PUR8_9EURY|nr:hypothetical protein [Halomicroarcula rubra]MBX0324260.1 hypothetical protein [Halomicroarcula rubra]